MQAYSVYGGRLLSELPLPELRVSQSDDASDWTFAIDATVSGDGTAIRPRTARGRACQVRLRISSEALHYEHTCTGTFCIDRDGHAIRLTPTAGVQDAAVRWDLISRVLLLAMHLKDVICLHGSAVAVGRTGLAFVAPPHHGKSTLALGFVRNGARLLTDDAIPLAVGRSVLVRPGDTNVRLLEDSFAALGTHIGAWGRSLDGKSVIRDFTPGQLMHSPVPLDAIYVLSPTLEAHESEAAWREPLAGVQAGMELTPHVKIGELLHGNLAARSFQQVMTLVERVPIYRLGFVKDYSRLSEVVGQITDWHSESGGDATCDERHHQAACGE